MNFYRNQEVLISAKFVGIADNGRVQVKIKGIDHIQLDIDPDCVFESGPRNRSESKSKSKSKSRSKRVEPQPEPEPEFDPEPEPEYEESIEDDPGADMDPEPEPIDPDPEQKEDYKVAESPQTPYNAPVDADASDRFHSKHKFKSMVVENDGMVLRTTESKSVMCGFGTYECSEEGFVYHWKVRVLEGDDDVNIGVIWTETAKKNRKQMWWLADEGYSYWGLDGLRYHSDKYKKYGETYGAGDEIDVWLNLKKWTVSFAKNGDEYGKAFKVDKDHAYRLGVGFNGDHAVELVEFNIE